MNTNTISPAVARSVLSFRGELGGWALGGFEEALLKAFSRADSQNFKRLAQGFPEHAQALRMDSSDLAEYEQNMREVKRDVRANDPFALTAEI